MNLELLHRIDRIEKEIDAEHAGAIDLRHVATHPMADANWADPQRTSFAPLGVERGAPELMAEGPLEWIEDMARAFLTGCTWLACVTLFAVGVAVAARALVNNWPQIVAALFH